MPDVRDDSKLNRTAEHYSKLLSLAVHEFRTPASVVNGYLGMLRRDRDPPLNDRQRKMIEEAEKSFARIISVVDEMSDIGKLDGGLITLSSPGPFVEDDPLMKGSAIISLPITELKR
jgi:signal transduction histidine kinase